MTLVKIKQQLVTRTNRVSKGTNSIKYITIHETANTGRGANAQAHANLQSNNNPRQASWHYQVDDKQIIQSFKDNQICWHAGKGNTQSIGVEICVNSDGDFNKAVNNAAVLVKLLMARHKLDTSKVVQHNFWTGKDCPTNLRSGSKGVNWRDFIDMLRAPSTTASVEEKKEVDIMSQTFKPTSATLDKAVQNVIYRLARQQDSKGNPLISDQWRKDFVAGKMTISDGLALLYVMIERGVIDNGKAGVKLDK